LKKNKCPRSTGGYGLDAAGCGWSGPDKSWTMPSPTSTVIQVFQIQIQTNNYIAKYNANAKTEFCLNPNYCHCY